MPRPSQTIDRYAHQLSGGQRQRAIIAMALVCHPSLLIADEPTTALDVTTEAQILELLLELQRDFGMAMQYITHNLGVVAELVDDVVVMYLGKPVEYGPVEDDLRGPAPPVHAGAAALDPEAREEVARAAGVDQGAWCPTRTASPPGCAFHPRCPRYQPGVCDEPIYVEVGAVPSGALQPGG